jgi:hypothetical protein
MSRTIDITDEFRETAIPQSLCLLTKLPPDWNEDGAAQPNDAALRAAAKVLECLSGGELPKPDINPSVEEGVCISFWHRDCYADIECFNTGEIVAAVMDEQRQHRTWPVRRTASDVMSAISQIKKHLTAATA